MSDSIAVCELDENGLCKTHAAGTPGDFEAQRAIVDDVIKAIGKAGMDLSMLGIALVDSAEGLSLSNERAKAVGQQPVREMEKECLAFLTPAVEALRTAIRGVKALRAGLPPVAVESEQGQVSPEEVDPPVGEIGDEPEVQDDGPGDPAADHKHPCGGSW